MERTRPQEPNTWADLAPVIRFKKKFPGNIVDYDYAAMGRRGAWYLCQNGRNHDTMTWDQLMVFIGERRWETVEIFI